MATSKRGALPALVVCGLAAAVLSMAQPGAASSSAARAIDTWKHGFVPLHATDLAATPSGATVLAAVPGDDPALGNELVEIDARTGRLRRHVYVGSNPAVVEVSPSGHRAYVGLRGSPAIVEVDLVRFRVARTFATDAVDWLGEGYVHDLEVLPSDESVVLASLFHLNQGPRGVVAAYDDGVHRERVSPWGSGGQQIESTAPGSVYAYNGSNTARGVHPVVVDPTGVTQTSPSLLRTKLGDDVEGIGDHLYGTNGVVVDPAAGSVVRTLPTAGRATRTADGSVAYLDEDTIERFSAADGSVVDSRTFDGITGDVTDLVPAAGGVAALTATGIHLVLPRLRLQPFIPPVARPAVPFEVRTIDLPSVDIHPDPHRRRVLVTVPEGAPEHGNRLVAMDPATGHILDAVNIGPSPAAMAMSDDGTRLYVAMEGASEIAIVDAGSLERTGSIALTGERWPLFAEDLVVMRGTTDVVVVSLMAPNISPRHMGVAVFADGVRLPNSTGTHTGATRIEQGRGAGTLYGINNASTLRGFYELVVDSSGIRVVAEARATLAPRGTDIEVVGDRLYESDGLVMDPAQAFALGRTRYGPFEVVGRSIFVADGSAIHQYDATRFRLIGSRSLPVLQARREVISWDMGLVVAGESQMQILRYDLPRSRPRR